MRRKDPYGTIKNREERIVADSNITKRALGAALKELIQEKPLDKISVGDICGKCEMNRKSFYYHFRDKYDLVNWIYDVEFIAVMGKKEYPDAWDLLLDICVYFYENRSFYKKALKTNGQNSFPEYFREYFEPVFGRYLEEVEDGEIRRFCVSFFTDSFLLALERWLVERMPIQPQEFLKRVRGSVGYLSVL